MGFISVFRLSILLLVANCICSFGYEVTYDNRAIKIDGARKLILSGSIHYPRSTPEMWPQLIRKAKEGGLNTIETYVFWNAHEPHQRQYDFSGNLDLIRFIKTIRDEGLYAILRIGPYVCAEWNYGGFPVWLHNLPGIQIRTNNEVYKNEMEIFTTLIVNMMKDGKLFASQGGPIILSQIENEYGNVQSSYGDEGKEYVKWCANLAESFKVGVPWIMCQQSDAPSPMIDSCNGFYCDQYYSNNKSLPKIWTENWTGWFQDWGQKNPHRSAEDVAFAVARFFQLGGSVMNYYMYHGGTNFGTTGGGPYITASYDYDAPLDEYGNLRQPKWGHLRDLHSVLNSMEQTLTYGESKNSNYPDNNNIFITIFAYQGKRSCFFSSIDYKDQTISFEGTDYFLPAWSVSILPDCFTEVYNTATVNVQTSIMENKANAADSFREPNSLQWKWRPEKIRGLSLQGDFVGNTLVANELMDQKAVTNGTSDYLWIMNNYDHNMNDSLWGAGKDIILQVHTNGHVVHAFVNGKHVGSQSASIESGRFDFVFESKIKLKRGINRISLVSVSVGLQNYGANFDTAPTGINGPITIIGRSKLGNQPDVTVDISSNRWVYKTGLHGEDQGFQAVRPRHRRQFYTKHVLINQPFVWYKTSFNAPLGQDPVVVDLLGLGKGTAWVNGRNIGRFWPKALAPDDGTCNAPCSYIGTYEPKQCVTGCGEPTQRYYHIPRDWLKPEDNKLVLFEELGGTPDFVSVQTVTVGKVCVHGYEGHTVELSCQHGRKFSKITFASFGLPQGKCGSFTPSNNHDCHADVSTIVEKACVGKERCSIDISEKALAPIHCDARIYRLAVEAVC
ncbi:beta-galactosidase 15 isoform X2 [Ricinus communis]|uniref:beta-galactosidase 15 isoform X2 n=1 Tax=Ricinus communis TaxID=3988 RepID=UPI00201A4477|nr:beta-galactosidase 15 isoform X2 [Ricinus communis]